MHFSAALIAALATGAIALPNYGYAEEEPCTEEEAKPTYPAVSTYSVPEAKSTPAAPVYYSSVQSKAPVYSAPAKSEDPEEPCTEEEPKATGYAPPAYSSVYSADPTKATYPAPVYPTGNNGTVPSGVPMPTGTMTTPIFSSTSTVTTFFTPSTTSESTISADPITTSTTTSTEEPTTTTTEEPTPTPTDDGCGSSDNPCDGGDVPCDGCDGDPIDGGNVPNDGGPDEEGDSSDAAICGSSNTPSCCNVPDGEDGTFVDSPNCSQADALTGCPTGTTYCCPLTEDMSMIDQTMQCAVINLFIG